MANLSDELEEVTTTKVTNKDFMTTVCFSIMGIRPYTNVIEIVMNMPMLEREDLIIKLTATKQ